MSVQNLKYPRGSEWRRWDLHVHTPFSVLNNGFGDDFEIYAKELFERAVEREIAVIGVTDYFLIDGYKALKALQQDETRLDTLVGKELGDKAREVLLLPNIELRLSVLVDNNRVNFHVIFSDAVDAGMIEEHFLRDLKFTSTSSAGGPDETWPLTSTNLAKLGEKLKQEHEEFQSKSDICVGMMTAVVAHEDITKVLQAQASKFREKYLFVVPADEDLSTLSWDGQGHMSRKLLIQKAHMFFSANPATRDFGLGSKHSTPQDFENEFGKLKPCIHGSDAHDFASLFEPVGRRYLWIKADPTFQGLQQLLHVPDERVRIGEDHPSLAREKAKATKYFDSLHFERTEQADPSEIWFTGEVSLNHGLVAIIGNKGTGKSALADILGLLGNTSNSKNFSFLHKDRFLQRKGRLGSMFRAELTWYSGDKAVRHLSDSIEPTDHQLVKYIAQNFLESICSELKQPLESQFYCELMEAIFSHVTDADRLGKETLSELIDYITSEKEERISQLTDELRAANARIAAREDQLVPEHRKALEAERNQRRADLKAHEASEPVKVAEPNQNAEQQEAAVLVKQELATLVERWEKLDEEIEEAEKGIRNAALKIAAADRLLARIENLKRQIDGFHTDSSTDGAALGLDTKELVTLTINRQPISNAREGAEAQRRALSESLNAAVEGSLVQTRNETKTKTEATRAKLDEPNRRYQEYLHLLAEWQKLRAVIDGSASVPESVKGLESKLSALEHLPTEIAGLKTRRFALVQEILQTKRELLEDFRKLHFPVQSFIEDHPVALQQKALEFAAELKVDGLEHGLLDMIHKGRKGSFQGEEGNRRLREIVENSDFSSDSAVEEFLTHIQDHLEYDKRQDEPTKMQVGEQLVQGKTSTDVYDFLYGLSYLKPQFELRWQGKSLDQLSQGERGSLLLVFYLLIDKRDVPLIIDQPEGSLDNESVVRMLVPAIRYAKERRQVILVTHNPNLAVVCDADQIIHAHLDRTTGNSVTYTTGSIEEPVITQFIVDVLEGTKPAFDMRDARYEILESSPVEREVP